MDETEKVLANFIADNVLKQPGYNLETDTRLISSGLIDSLSIVDLAIFIEDRFGVKLKVTELNAETFDLLNELACLIEERQKIGARRQ
jgi:acyl carrier protein